MNQKKTLVLVIILPIFVFLLVSLFNKPSSPSVLVEPMGFKEQKEFEEAFANTKAYVDGMEGKHVDFSTDDMKQADINTEFTIGKLDSFDSTLSEITSKQGEIKNASENTIKTANQSMANWVLPDVESSMPELKEIPTLNVKMLSMSDAIMPNMPSLLDLPSVTYPDLYSKFSSYTAVN